MTLPVQSFASAVSVLGAVLSSGIAAPHVAAQTTIVSLPWTDGFSAGPLAKNYPAAQDDRDVWVGEDFETDRPWALGKFSSWGSGIGGATDVFATVYDDIPTVGSAVMTSVRGTGKYVRSGVWGYYETDFGGQVLAPGRYWIIWQVDGNPSTITPVIFVQTGPYAVGAGTPDNAYQYNPGGYWDLPEGPWDPVTDQLDNMGDPIGVNFTLKGTEAGCPADFNGDGFVTGDDFDAFVLVFVAGDLAADFNRDGFVTGDDFDAFVAAFAAGC